MMLGGRGRGYWSMTFITALSADFSFSCDYAFLWLDTPPAVSNLYFSDSCSYASVATGKHETVKEAQVSYESMKT